VINKAGCQWLEDVETIIFAISAAEDKEASVSRRHSDDTAQMHHRDSRGGREPAHQFGETHGAEYWCKVLTVSKQRLAATIEKLGDRVKVSEPE
jgi:hypothetical protein